MKKNHSRRVFTNPRGAPACGEWRSCWGWSRCGLLDAVGVAGRGFPRGILRKEVIQPQVPLRLPCYDLVPIDRFVFGACLLAVGIATSDAPIFRGLTGGVYKAQEHIHRGVADPRLLAIPTSRRRVAASDLNWGVFFGICSPSRACVPLFTPL